MTVTRNDEHICLQKGSCGLILSNPKPCECTYWCRYLNFGEERGITNVAIPWLNQGNSPFERERVDIDHLVHSRCRSTAKNPCF